MQDSLPDYDALSRAVAHSDLSPSPAEVQGVFCGLLAARVEQAEERWLRELLPASDAIDPAAEESRDLFEELARATRAQISDPAVDFQLLLPSDETSLRERAVAVHDWSRGFLFGLGLAGVEPSTFSGQGREVMRDFVELTRMDPNDLEDNEENERALVEVVEFVRVATRLVFEAGLQGEDG